MCFKAGGVKPSHVTCPECGHKQKYDENVWTCEACGYEMPKPEKPKRRMRECPECGLEQPFTNRTCSQCGYKFPKATARDLHK